MSDPFIAEIRIFAGNFAPRQWAYCSGQILPIAQNTALFSLIGTIYGGDGRTTTALPDLQDRMPMHYGNGPGLTSRRIGERLGVADVTLSAAEMPNHDHQVRGNGAVANHAEPAARELAKGPAIYNSVPGSSVAMHPNTVPNQGGGQAHNNQSPFLNLGFIIALQGTFPSRS